MNRRMIALLASAVLACGRLLAQQDNRPEIEIAVCLDTSGSMDGLIESAKQKLWGVVTDLGTAKPNPRLRVALYQYGNNSLDQNSGWVQQLCPLTDDLDTVYGKLFALRTNGGTEYVARVVKDASERLEWSTNSGTLRMIVVAGNEPATQDTQVRLEDACKLAAGRGIIVNTVFCGGEAEGRGGGWADAAKFADGRYSAIDQNGGTVVIESPFDKEIAELGVKLNSTYVAYGAQGAGGAANQAAQDANAIALSAPAAAARSVAKASTQYSNARWDLVDAVKQQKVELASVKESDLPAELRPLPADERAKVIEQKSVERQEIQTRIQSLNAQREAYIKEETAKRGLNDKSAFDTALKQAIHEQAAKKGMSF